MRLNQRLSVAVSLFGSWMQRNSSIIYAIQWSVVAIYLMLLIIPLFYPLPSHEEHILSNVVIFAQFVFWGIWWPFVILSMFVLGRMWCGVFCPEGALSEAACKTVGRNLHIPRIVKWQGWPAVGFVILTLYGQLISVYDYAKAALLILGGSTGLAILIGILYGKKSRVWCRFLCPVSGVFNLLSRLAPISLKTDIDTWQNYASKPKNHPICPPMISIKNLHGVSSCHMCGHCIDYRDAVRLVPRSVHEEVTVYGDEKTNIWEMRLLLYGMIGVAIGAFTWTVSSRFIWYKQTLAKVLIDHNIFWPFSSDIPWWLLTHYPEVNDSFNWLDGFCITTYILGSGLIFGLFLSLFLSIINYLSDDDNNLKMHLAQAYLPIAGAGLFLGLSATSVKLLMYDGIYFAFTGYLRAAILGLTTYWCLYLAYKILLRYQFNPVNRISCLVLFGATLIPINTAWYFMFWG